MTSDWTGFNPDFDDTTWNEDWSRVAVALVPPGIHAGDTRVERQIMHEAMIFDRPYRLSAPFDARVLYDDAGRLWMSNTPQEHIMMCNNGAASQGHVLVGGLGLGVYPQYAALSGVGRAERFTVIERDPTVRDIVAPTLLAALAEPVDVLIDDVAAFLADPPDTRYDTIFLDTWDTLDPVQLPVINHLRNLALNHLTPDGRVLLWGYRWIVRLFEDACRQLLSLPPDQRADALAAAGQSPAAIRLLTPVLDHFADYPTPDPDSAQAWCWEYAIHITA
ncbi:MAG: hypothetical protein K8S97_04130 [Anaerolineae bacterium]|nr:hypothetical protein [Anaerolineae bacterium]